MSPELFATELTMALIGASYGVDIMCALRSGWTFPVDLADITAMCDQRLALRYLVRGCPPGQESKIEPSLRAVVGSSWQIRCSFPDRPTGNCIMVDGDCAFLMSVDTSRTGIHHVTDLVRLGQLSGRFERLWEGAQDADARHFTYEADLDCLGEADVSRILTFSSAAWESVVRSLLSRPDDIYSLSSRRFEELMAELLRRDGYLTELTPISRDGGRDVLATLDTPVGKQLYLVECKRYAKDRPVDVRIVRELFGVVTAEHATGGLVATTSSFTRDAQVFQRTQQYQLGLRDFNDLQKWLRRVVGLG